MDTSKTVSASRAVPRCSPIWWMISMSRSWNQVLRALGGFLLNRRRSVGREARGGYISR